MFGVRAPIDKCPVGLTPHFMYLLTEWDGRMGNYLARGHGVRTQREVRAPCPRAKYFPVRPDLDSVNKHFIIWALYTIHEHSEYEVCTKVCTDNVSNMMFAFPFLAVNNLDVEKRRNNQKFYRAEQYVFLAGQPYGPYDNIKFSN